MHIPYPVFREGKGGDVDTDVGQYPIFPYPISAAEGADTGRIDRY